MLIAEEIRKDFPLLQTQVNGKPLVYLDNAATTQKPQCVLDAMMNAYTHLNANVHRGTHYLSQMATEAHEGARETVRKFIGAEKTSEIIFTRGTTESINLVASSFARTFCNDGDEIIVSEMEHHSDIVPWQLQQEIKDIKIKVLPFADNGELMIDRLEDLITDRTRLIAVAHVSNSLGTINPVREIIKKAHARGVKVLVDGAQSVPHISVNVRELDADFYAFSGHKIYGPTGIGVLYGKEELLERMPPYQGGGEMIQNVSFEKTTFNELPYKFEAGTPDYIGSAALATALDYVSAIGLDAIAEHEHLLLRRAEERLREIENIRIFGEAKEKCGLVSFLVGEVHPYDIGTLIDKLGVAVRTGHHCAEPVMRHFGIEGTVRASFAMYNTEDEIDVFAAALARVAGMFGRRRK